MYKTSKYTPTDKMSYLICDNYTLLQVKARASGMTVNG